MDVCIEVRLLLVTAVVSWCFHCAQANSGYLVVCPSLLRPGSDEVLTVTILQPSQPIYVEAKLFSKAGHLVTEAGGEIFGKGTLKLKIPWDVSGRCTLKVCGNCRSSTDDTYTFYNSTIIMVEQKGASAFIQTDKPLYKPGQKVHINVITTGPDLLPVNDKLQAYIVDPRGSKMIEWSNLQPYCCGLTNVTYPLSSQPLLGRWTVYVLFQGHTYNRSFEIQKYVLPKFEVSIETPEYIENWRKIHTVIVRSRYTYGRDVSGFLTVSMQVQGTGYYKTYVSNTTEKAVQMMGAAAFNVCVAELMSSVNIPPHFRGVLHIEAVVQTEDGAVVKATDSSCPVNKHLVELEFTSDTRQHFKPGLPFTGKLLTYYPDGSPASNITVEVKAELSSKRVQFESYWFLSDEEGLVNFHLPALPRTTHTIWIEAKVVCLNGYDVSKDYLPVYLAINSWYSPSDCHMVVEGPPHLLKVGNMAGFRVHSTCPCNFTLYHEVMARGNLVHSGIHYPRHIHKRAIKFAEQDYVTFEEGDIVAEEHDYLGTKTCTVGMKFHVTHQMAPLSRLLVYYVRPNGEGVADSLRFNVQPQFKNRVSIELSEREAQPGDLVTMHVNTQPDSCVCIGAVDKSVHLLRPGYQLSQEEIFDELETYDISTEEFLNKRKGSRSRRSIANFWPRRSTRSRDAYFAFEEAGLLVMTDSVQLHFKQTAFFTPPLQVQAHRGSQKEIRLQKKLIRRRRSYFPETWIWSCFNTSSTRKEMPLQVKVPDTITSWVIDGISLNQKFGLALAEPVQIKTFKDFFMQFNTPYSVTRGEQIKIPLTIHNYLNRCAKIHLHLRLPAGVQYVPSRHDHLHRMCIGSEEVKTISPVLVFSTVGKHNITAEAEAFADNMCCSGIVSDDEPKPRDKIGEDFLEQSILTEAEGVKKGYTHSTFFCPNERLHLMTPDLHEFQYLRKPALMEDRFQFSVQASNDVRVALSLLPVDTEDMFEVVLGGLGNTHSWIAQGKEGEHLTNTSTEGIVSGVEFRHFWISWHNGHIKVGEDSSGENETVLLDVISNRPMAVKYIGFATAYGATGLFRIWTKADENGFGYNEIFNLDLPSNVIPDSQKATVNLIGDVMGPTLYNLENLLKMPAGCGEQNMINFAPNVYVLHYLNRTGQLTEQVRARAVSRLVEGYQRQLTYRRQDGAYSAFGERDGAGSMWLTSFVVRCYTQAQQYIFIDEKEINQSVSWILDHQRPDGSFPAVGRLINKNLQGGMPGKVSLTAYVLLSLLDAGIHKNNAYLWNIKAAQMYLERSSLGVTDPYTAALVSLALARLKSEHMDYVVNVLHDMAIVRDGFKYWKHFGNPNELDILLFMQDPSQMKVSAGDVEVAAYALLTMLELGDVNHALPTVKWLSMQRNPSGGFTSTQDSVIALQALSEFAIATYSNDLNVSVNLAALEVEKTVKLNRSQPTVSVDLPTLPTGLFTSGSGTGCALIQVDVSYNVPDPTLAPSFEILVRIAKQRQKHRNRTERIRRTVNLLASDFSEEFKVTLEACARWLHNGSSNMAVLEMGILTGFKPDMASLDQLLQHRHLQLKKYEFDGRKVMFYFDEIRSNCLTCVSFEAVREYIVGKTQPVLVRVYDYYEPSYEASQFYNASHIGELIQDLCEDKECNEIKEDVELPESEEDCNSIFGCYGNTKQHMDFCTCYRDCPKDSIEVCASDGQLYNSRCHMQVLACQQDVYLEVMPEYYCHPEPLEDLVLDVGSGDSSEMSGEDQLTTVGYLREEKLLPTVGYMEEAASTMIAEENIVTGMPLYEELITAHGKSLEHSLDDDLKFKKIIKDNERIQKKNIFLVKENVLDKSIEEDNITVMPEPFTTDNNYSTLGNISYIGVTDVPLWNITVTDEYDEKTNISLEYIMEDSLWMNKTNDSETFNETQGDDSNHFAHKNLTRSFYDLDKNVSSQLTNVSLENIVDDNDYGNTTSLHNLKNGAHVKMKFDEENETGVKVLSSEEEDVLEDQGKNSNNETQVPKLDEMTSALEHNTIPGENNHDND